VWHVRDFPPQAGAGQIFRQALRRFPSRVLVNSAAVGDTLRALGAASSRVTVLHNPVDLDRFNPAASKIAARATMGLVDDGPVVGLVAHLTPWKGHSRFLHIARRVLDAIPQAHFVIAGGPIYETDGHDGYVESLKNEARALDLEKRVVFLGNSDDVASVIAALDVLVHCPTAPEPFGRVVAEAMASARPVVAARCGGIPEVVSERSGFLIEGDDVDGFARAVIALLADAELAAMMGRAGRGEAERRFGIAQHADRVFGVYQELRDIEAIP
jgi:glycosyltransferase involved in cell wall biosynthesis